MLRSTLDSESEPRWAGVPGSGRQRCQEPVDGPKGKSMVATPDGSAPVTLADVAALARVSTATASKALNDRPGISERTREQVRRAANSLSYGKQSGGVVGQAALTVGVIVTMLDSHWVTPIVEGIEEVISPADATIFLSPPSRGINSVRARFEAMLAHRVDGAVVISDSTNAVPPLAEQPQVPVVYAYGPSSGPEDVSFTPDNVQAGRLIAEHLLSRQRTRAAFINGDPGFDAARDRVKGFMEAFGDGELVGREAVFGDWSEGWGRRGITSLLDSGAGIDAVVAGADRVARGVMDVLRAYGKRIPQDVAVAGFDNWDELAMNAWPPLTTIDMNLPELGRQVATELRVQMEGGRSEPGVRRLPVRLVPRESTASF